MKAVLFYWGKGSEVRVKILLELYRCSGSNTPCYLNSLADYLKLSHVAVKKHLDLLLEHKYVRPVNPLGKPVYLELSEQGNEVVKEFLSK
ncbi:MAG: hypothetical protein Q7S92_03585 [Candidatus Diapherotrites archaeon]|nr:hypothetical protein [Candidatus Diapherotrites archaeon]